MADVWPQWQLVIPDTGLGVGVNDPRSEQAKLVVC